MAPARKNLYNAATVPRWLRGKTPNLICAFLALGVSIWENPGLVAREGQDTQEYVAVAHSMFDKAARQRPPVYPIYLRLCMTTDDWERTALIGQKLSVAFLAAVLVSLFRRLGLPAGWSVGGGLLCSISPATLGASDFILPEVGVVVGLAFLWKWVVDLEDKAGPRLVRAAAVAGSLSGSVALLKPVWAGGIVFVGAAWLLVGKRRPGVVRAVIAMVACHVAICVSWDAFLAMHFGQWTLSRTGTIAFNLSAIRAGLVDSGRGTKLYEYLETSGLLEDARRLKRDDFEGFTKIKDGIPLEAKADGGFARRIARECIWDYLRVNLARVPVFFMTRSALPDGAFPRMPWWLKGLYVRLYDDVVRVPTKKPDVPVLLVMLLVSGTVGMLTKETRVPIAIGASMIAYFGLVVPVLSYQDQNFMRFRAEIEAVMLAVAGGPVAYGAWRVWLVRSRSGPGVGRRGTPRA